jgi:hypothetical protein
LLLPYAKQWGESGDTGPPRADSKKLDQVLARLDEIEIQNHELRAQLAQLGPLATVAEDLRGFAPRYCDSEGAVDG